MALSVSSSPLPLSAITSIPYHDMHAAAANSFCLLNPSDHNAQFSVLYPDFTPAVNRGGLPGSLLDSDFADGIIDPETWNASKYYFQQAPGAESDLYDLILDDPNVGPLLVGMTDEYDAVFTDVSSGGSGKVIDSLGRSVVTTIFGVSCHGQLHINWLNSTFIWEKSGNVSMFILSDGLPEPAHRMQILPTRLQDGTNRTAQYSHLESYAQLNAFSKMTAESGSCESSTFPWPIHEDVAPHPSRDARSNGCGSGFTSAITPQFGFKECCNTHDLCYDNCQTSWRDCNAGLEQCMQDVCNRKHSLGKLACKFERKLYSWFIDSFLGANAYRKAHKERCACYCATEPGKLFCKNPDQCVDPLDRANCGACGNQCKDGFSCIAGTCVMHSKLTRDAYTHVDKHTTYAFTHQYYIEDPMHSKLTRDVYTHTDEHTTYAFTHQYYVDDPFTGTPASTPEPKTTLYVKKTHHLKTTHHVETPTVTETATRSEPEIPRHVETVM